MSLQTDLAQFTGTEHYYEHWTKKLVCTDGVQYMAEKYQAHWLVDAIASFQPIKGEGLDEFQLWALTVKGSRAIIRCRADSDEPAIIKQSIHYTDFPESITLYVENGVLLLQSEH